MNTEAIITGINQYFKGERSEMALVIFFSVLIGASAVWLFLAYRDSFSKGFAIVVVLFSFLFTGVAVSVLFRDRPYEQKLVKEVSSEDGPKAVHQEIERMNIVISKYPAGKKVTLVVVLFGVVSIFLFRRPVVEGVVVGLLLVGASQIVMDHYSEERAVEYESFLRGERG